MLMKTLQIRYIQNRTLLWKTYLSKGEIKKIETQNCRSVHEGCRIHFTDGVLRSECNNVFQLKYVTRQKKII